MKFTVTSIPDVILVEPIVYGDARGYFMETFHAEVFKQAGIDVTFVQDNQSGSGKGTLRGLHYQIRHSQGKLIRAISGTIFDIVVDLRRSSTTFGQHLGITLSAENKSLLWIPPGFAHGFYVVSDWAEFIYKVTDFYAPEWERTLRWDDPTLAIEWPLIDGLPPILSEKDRLGMLLEEIEFFD